MKLAPTRKAAPLFKRERVAAPDAEIVDMKRTVATTEAAGCPCPNERDAAQQNVTRHRGPRHDAGELVDEAFHRQKYEREPDSADHEAIPARLLAGSIGRVESKPSST